MTLLTLDRISVTRRDRAVLRDITLSVGAGELVGVIGPNGAGKTTLLRTALGLVAHEGHSSLAALPEPARARAAAWLPQTREIAWPVSVETLVGLGRLPHLGPGRRMGAADRVAVDHALDALGLGPLRPRTATRLSGGEQARVLIARALAQDTPLLLADEPIAGLDPEHQIATMTVFATLAAEGRGVIVSLHDLGLAVRHCTRLLVLDHGRLVADGPPREVLTPDLVARVFRVSAHFADTPQGPVFQPLEVLPCPPSP
ncbi:ABC transporter ATP-binding protein [Salipiger marinus]|uniref:Iron complex transport system ATP-binding protein n=1 Tax=Salipiger marinus TaxID=555512 RepID=A0A1G8KHM6_9RHOB|nr:ABC transporter ATP-binding protein [Salipiger marinus]SDI42892.1 iron complex transport system ATP-binding protein [Salipiger marinus]